MRKRLCVVVGFTLVGVVQLEDEPAYHVRGPVTGSALADLLNDSPVPGRDGEVDYWIGFEDFSVRKIAIRSESPAGPGGATSVTQVAMTISDLGKPVDIMGPRLVGRVAGFGASGASARTRARMELPAPNIPTWGEAIWSVRCQASAE